MQQSFRVAQGSDSILNNLPQPGFISFSPPQVEIDISSHPPVLHSTLQSPQKLFPSHELGSNSISTQHGSYFSTNSPMKDHLSCHNGPARQPIDRQSMRHSRNIHRDNSNPDIYGDSYSCDDSRNTGPPFRPPRYEYQSYAKYPREFDPLHQKDEYYSGFIAGFQAGLKHKNNNGKKDPIVVSKELDRPPMSPPIFDNPPAPRRSNCETNTPAQTSLFVTDMDSRMGKHCLDLYKNQVSWLSKKRCPTLCRVYCTPEIADKIDEMFYVKFQWKRITIHYLWEARKNNCNEILYRHKHNPRHVIRNLVIRYAPKNYFKKKKSIIHH